ncbi:MAG: hypothetical protein U5N10_02190 [Gemmobacter sp.]|nr:hypothetical protein [Gemmobacter sp.]
MQWNDWLTQASATFAGGVVAIGLVAVPTFVWLPREFDRLSSLMNEAKAAAVMASTTSTDAKDQLDRLVQSTARAAAQPLVSFVSYAPGPIENKKIVSAFKKIVSADVASAVISSDAAAGVYISGFDGREWVFVENDSFNKLSAELQKNLEASLTRNDVVFVLERPNLIVSSTPFQ